MSMPKIPDLNPNITINREDSVNLIIASIAMEELALAHILNAEGEKLQYVLGTLDGKDPGEITICDIMAVNNSIQKTLRDVIKAEMLLQLKLEDTIELSEGECGCQITVRGQKIWKDNNNVDKTRPADIKINLLRDGEIFQTVTISSTGNGVYTFPCLPVWKDSNNKYIYQIDEDAVPAGYTKTINGFNITNTILPGSMSINGRKIWNDNNNENQKRPDVITVNLLRNGIQYLSSPLNKPADTENTVLFNFPNVPRFDSEGNLFVYTVDESHVDEYEKSIEGFEITNTIGTP